MRTQATVARGEIKRKFEIQETSWIHGLGSVGAPNASSALLIGISGELAYEHLLELCSYISRYWKPEREHLVLDFTELESAEADGIYLLMSQVYKASTRCVGRIYLVKAPLEARVFLKRVWGTTKTHFADSVEEVIGALR